MVNPPIEIARWLIEALANQFPGEYSGELDDVTWRNLNLPGLLGSVYGTDASSSAWNDPTDILRYLNGAAFLLNSGAQPVQIADFQTDNNISDPGMTLAVLGTAGSDSIAGTSGNELFLSGLGNDSIASGGGSDIVFGGEGDDSIRGEGGDDLLVGDTSDRSDLQMGNADEGNDFLDWVLALTPPLAALEMIRSLVPETYHPPRPATGTATFMQVWGVTASMQVTAQI